MLVVNKDQLLDAASKLSKVSNFSFGEQKEEIDDICELCINDLSEDASREEMSVEDREFALWERARCLLVGALASNAAAAREGQPTKSPGWEKLVRAKLASIMTKLDMKAANITGVGDFFDDLTGAVEELALLKANTMVLQRKLEILVLKKQISIIQKRKEAVIRRRRREIEEKRERARSGQVDWSKVAPTTANWARSGQVDWSKVAPTTANW